jgi:Tol biopolymer transport system component
VGGTERIKMCGQVEGHWRKRLIVAAAGVALGTLVVAAPAVAGKARTELVSVGLNGLSTGRNVYGLDISASGRFVAFSSKATKLVRGDTNGRADIFVRDRKTRRTRRVSVSSAGRQANGDSLAAAISADGRFVVFWSQATNLIRGDTNHDPDVFVRDREKGKTVRVNVSSSGAQANDYTDNSLGISASGRFVGFSSLASNLVGEDADNGYDAFVRDRRTGTTELVSVSSTGAQVGGSSGIDSISAKGRFVAMTSSAKGLVPGDTNNEQDVFVHDRATGETSRVSVSSTGEQTEGFNPSWEGSISAGGRFVAFGSTAPNLVPEDTNESWDVFVHDRETGETSRVSVRSSGEEAPRGSYGGALSANGRFVAFYAFDRMIKRDTNRAKDVFLHDRRTGTTRMLSVTPRGAPANGNSDDTAISAGGGFVAFVSHATNLVHRDKSRGGDVFVRGPLR